MEDNKEIFSLQTLFLARDCDCYHLNDQTETDAREENENEKNY